MADYNNTRDSSLPDPASPGFRDGDTITLQNGSKFSRQSGRWEPVRFQTVGQQSKEVPVFASPSAQGVKEVAGGVVIRSTPKRYPQEKWELAKLRVETGTGNARDFFLLDSKGMGAWGGGTDFADNAKRAWPAQIAELSKTLSVSKEGFYGTNGVTINSGGWPKWLSYDPRISNVNQTIWDLNSSSYQVGCHGMRSPGATSSASVSFSFTPTKPFDTIDFYVHRLSGLGSFTVDVDGSNAQVVDCSVGAVLTIQRVTVTVPYGNHTINITKIGSASLRIRGMHCYKANSEVLVINGSWNAMSAWGYLTGGVGGAEPSDGPRKDFAAIAPDRTTIGLGTNDSTLGKTVAEFKAGMQALIDLGKATGDVQLCIPDPTSYAAGTGNPNQDQYWDAIFDLGELNLINVIDLREFPMESWDAANARGLYSDGRHALGTGQRATAKTFFKSANY